ncbi:MAG: LysR family transcriptional regulator [Aquisalimonadaceae bacterium]
MNSLNWSDLRFFLAVARCGSLAKAATRLGVTHSTVFRRMNSLEASVDSKLFVRCPEGYRLTDLGREMFTYVDEISDRIDALQRVLDSRNDRLEGMLNVTAPHNLAYRYLPPFLTEFRALYPDFHINLTVSNADLNLSRREADLAIRATPAPPEHLIGYKLCAVAWGAYASEDYVARYGSPSDDSELKGHYLISSHTDLIRLPAFDWLERNMDLGDIVMRCNDLVSMSAMAMAGMGIAFLPDDQAKPELKRLFTFPPGLHSHLWLLTHPDLRDSRALKVFKSFLIDKFRHDPTFQEYGLDK